MFVKNNNLTLFSIRLEYFKTVTYNYSIVCDILITVIHTFYTVIIFYRASLTFIITIKFKRKKKCTFIIT